MVHDRDTIRNLSYDREVMGDEEHGQAVLFGEVGEQIQNLRLNRDIEGRDRLVGHNKLGPRCQRATNGNALALPT